MLKLVSAHIYLTMEPKHVLLMIGAGFAPVVISIVKGRKGVVRDRYRAKLALYC